MLAPCGEPKEGCAVGSIEGLTVAVERIHGCKAVHTQTTPVHEVFHGKTVWKGIVEVFELAGHPQARRCYAGSGWEDLAGHHGQIVTVLGQPPVDSPLGAVRSVLFGVPPEMG
jgi:hypothetical protein